jgi:hypothetical protein
MIKMETFFAPAKCVLLGIFSASRLAHSKMPRVTKVLSMQKPVFLSIPKVAVDETAESTVSYSDAPSSKMRP